MVKKTSPRSGAGLRNFDKVKKTNVCLSFTTGNRKIDKNTIVCPPLTTGYQNIDKTTD
jgi:hypothetical protein